MLFRSGAAVEETGGANLEWSQIDGDLDEKMEARILEIADKEDFDFFGNDYFDDTDQYMPDNRYR